MSWLCEWSGLLTAAAAHGVATAALARGTRLPLVAASRDALHG